MDLDLFVNFKSEDDVLSCTVGYPNQHCGLTAYHGDNKGSKLGRSTEAITIKVVGRFDYLVYINALLKQDNVKGATIPPAQYQHILLARPVLKYYNSQSEGPIRGFYLWKMQQSGSNVFKGLIDLADLQPYEENPRFGLAAFCILVSALPPPPAPPANRQHAPLQARRAPADGRCLTAFSFCALTRRPMSYSTTSGPGASLTRSGRCGA